MTMLAHALKDGADKYGEYNWRDYAIENGGYVAACMRHLQDYYAGEETAPDSGIHHIAHAMATLAILMDAIVRDYVVDTRPKPAPTTKMVNLDGSVGDPSGNQTLHPRGESTES